MAVMNDFDPPCSDALQASAGGLQPYRALSPSNTLKQTSPWLLWSRQRLRSRSQKAGNSSAVTIIYCVATQTSTWEVQKSDSYKCIK